MRCRCNFAFLSWCQYFLLWCGFVFAVVVERALVLHRWHRPRPLRMQRCGRALREPCGLPKMRCFKQLRPVIRVHSCGGEENGRQRHRHGPVNRGTKGLGQRASTWCVAMCRPRSAPGLLRGGAAGEALRRVRLGPSCGRTAWFIRSIFASKPLALALCSRDSVCLRRCAEPKEGNHVRVRERRLPPSKSLEVWDVFPELPWFLDVGAAFSHAQEFELGS